MNTDPLISSSEALRQIRQLSINPVANLTAYSLTRALENFAYGNLREAAQLFEAIAQRDDTIPGVKGKREKEVSQLGCEVVADDKSDRAQAHKKALEDFWGSVKAVDAYDRNFKGGFKRLVKQMMTAVSYKYSAHHIVWDPAPGRLRATFQHVPLWLCENTTGSLRYLENPHSTSEGKIMSPGDWMVTASDGLMIPCSIGYFFKRDGLNTWAIFCQKFSIPGIVGATSAGPDTDEGRAMASAIKTYANDWAAALYNVKDPSKLPIHLVQPNGNPSAMPQPAMVERVDRKFASLYRGGDLSTMSSRDGQGQGASLQDTETEILTADDAATIEETLTEISERVIWWYFREEPMAKVILKVKNKRGKSEVQSAAGFIAKQGGRVDLKQVAENLDVPLADDDEQALGEIETAPKPEPPRRPEANAITRGPAKDLQWMRFNKASGSLGIPRAEMPQIKSSDHAAFLNFLKKRGITSNSVMIKGSKLKPTQAEYSMVKTMAAAENTTSRRSVLASNDRYILDGHHAWMPTTLEDQMLNIILIDAPILRLLPLAMSFPSSRISSESNDDLPSGADDDQEAFSDDGRKKLLAGMMSDLRPIAELLDQARTAEDETSRDALLQEAQDKFDEMTTPETVEVYESLLSSAYVNGLAEESTTDS